MLGRALGKERNSSRAARTRHFLSQSKRTAPRPHGRLWSRCQEPSVSKNVRGRWLAVRAPLDARDGAHATAVCGTDGMSGVWL